MTPSREVQTVLPLGVVGLSTRYELDCWRLVEGVWRRIWHEDFHNLVVTSGLTAILDLAFRTGVGANAWFMGLVNAAGFAGYAAGDTMAAHAGWAEAINYADVTRPSYTPSAAAGGSLDNGAARGSFHIASAATLRGAFLTNQSTPGGVTGTLYGAGDFTLARAVVLGDTINAKATLTAVAA